jgi:hypothetical protein
MLACDTIERIRDGMRRYIVTFIDPVSHLALAVGLPSRHARHTAPRLGLVLAAPAPPSRTLLSDSGIGRWYTYFNRKLANWLVFDNAERPHHTLGQQSPLAFL